MATSSSEESLWADGVAARLRLVQVSCADDPPERRHEYLCETVADALKHLPGERRRTYLAALATRFPAWAAPASGPASATRATEETPEDLVERLLKVWGKLPEPVQQFLLKKMAEAGLLPRGDLAPAGGALADSLKNLEKSLGLAQAPRWERAAWLLGLLADLMEKVDQVACKTLEKLPSKPDFREVRAGDLLEAVRHFLTAAEGENSEALTQPVQRILERHRRAMVALIACHLGMKNVPSVGGEYAKWFREYFSPQNIEDVVRTENRGFLLPGALESKCWKKYAQRFQEHMSTPEHIDRKVKEAAATTAERVFQLRG